MKPKHRIAFAFVIGVLVSSLGWFGHLAWFQFQVTNALLLDSMQDSLMGKRIFEMINTETNDTERLRFIALNLADELPTAVEYLSDAYPYLPIERYWADKAGAFTDFTSTNRKEQTSEQPDGAVTQESAPSAAP